MSYALIQCGEALNMVDLTSITKGATSRGMKVSFKTKKGVSSGTFIDYGTRKEMETKKKEMIEMKNGKPKRGRKKKEPTIGFTIHPPNGGETEELRLNEGEDATGDMGEEVIQTSKMILRTRFPFLSTRQRGDTPQLNSPLNSRSPSPILNHSSPIHNSSLRALLQENLAPLSSSLQHLKRSVNRLENSSSDDTNALESISHKVRLLEERDRRVADNLEKVTGFLEKVVDSLPAGNTDFDYTYIAKDVVDLHDENENLLLFATRMDEILFPRERDLRLNERDPRKVKWLYDLLCHRRKISIGPDRTQRLKQVKNRLNGNVYKYIHKKTAVPRTPRELPRSQSGRFIPVLTPTIPRIVPSSTHSINPVFTNGQWMLPLEGRSLPQYPSNFLTIPHSTHNDVDDISSPMLVSHPHFLPPRMSNYPAYSDESEDYMRDSYGEESDI